MFFLVPNSLLTAKQANISAVVIGCRLNNTSLKSLDIHFNLDNKEYSLTLEK